MFKKEMVDREAVEKDLEEQTNLLKIERGKTSRLKTELKEIKKHPQSRCASDMKIKFLTGLDKVTFNFLFDVLNDSQKHNWCGKFKKKERWGQEQTGNKGLNLPLKYQLVLVLAALWKGWSWEDFRNLFDLPGTDWNVFFINWILLLETRIGKMYSFQWATRKVI